MFCSFHKERLAHDKCFSCDLPICSDCQRTVSGKVYCPNCCSSGEKIRDKKFFERNPVVAALLGIFPGLGQVYNGQLLKGFFIFFTSWLLVPWFYGMYDAYATACHINNHEVETNPSPALLTGCLVLIILILGIFSGGPFFLIKGIPYVIQKITGSSPELQVKKILQDISGAVQSYKMDNGNYPADITDLYFGEIPYLSEMYCDTVKGNYRYNCEFQQDGYLVTVTPLKQGLPGYRMEPGPVVERFQ